MIEAEKLNIPVRLGDAPQNDTLNNIKGIISKDVFDPRRIFEGSLFLVGECVHHMHQMRRASAPNEFLLYLLNFFDS